MKGTTAYWGLIVTSVLFMVFLAAMRWPRLITGILLGVMAFAAVWAIVCGAIEEVRR